MANTKHLRQLRKAWHHPLWKTILENLDLPYNVSLAKDENYLTNTAQWHVLGKIL